MDRILLLILSTFLMCACGKSGYSESDVMTVYKYNRTSTGCICGPTRDYILIEECNKLAYTDTIFIDEKSFDKIRNALTTKKKVKYDNPYQLRLYVKADSTEFTMDIGDNVGVVPGDSVFYHVDDEAMYLLKSKIHYYDYTLERWALEDMSYRKFGKPEDVKVYADIRDIPPKEVVREFKKVYSKVLLVKK